MTFLSLVPAVISFLLLAAHFLRGWNMLLVGICLVLPLLLFVKRRWAARLLQAALIVGALEWAATTFNLTMMRISQGADWERMAIILGAVTLWTGLSAALFQTKRLARRYRQHAARATERPQ